MVLEGAAVSARVRTLERRNADLEEFAKEAEETIETLARVKEQDENTIRELKEEIEGLKVDIESSALAREEQATEILGSLPSTVSDLRAGVVSLTQCLSDKEAEISSLKGELAAIEELASRAKAITEENEKLKEERAELSKSVQNLTKHKQLSLETEEILRESIAELEKQLHIGSDLPDEGNVDEQHSREARTRDSLEVVASDCIEALCSFLPDSLSSEKLRVTSYFYAHLIQRRVEPFLNLSDTSIKYAMRDCQDTLSKALFYLKRRSYQETPLLPALRELNDAVVSFEDCVVSLEYSSDPKLLVLTGSVAKLAKLVTPSEDVEKTLKHALNSAASKFRNAVSDFGGHLARLEGELALSKAMNAELVAQLGSKKKSLDLSEARAAIQREQLKAALAKADTASDLRVKLRTKERELRDLQEKMTAFREVPLRNGLSSGLFMEINRLQEALECCSKKNMMLQRKIMMYVLKDLLEEPGSGAGSRDEMSNEIDEERYKLKRAMASAQVVDVVDSRERAPWDLQLRHPRSHLGRSGYTLDTLKTLQRARSMAKRLERRRTAGSLHVKVKRGFVSRHAGISSLVQSRAAVSAVSAARD